MRIVYSFPETIKETEQKIEKIKEQGFDAVQIPPIEPLKEEDKMEISGYYGVSSECLDIYLSLLSNFRNVCAHEEVLYDHRTQRDLPNSRYHKLLDIQKVDDEYIYGKNDLFAIVIILKQLLTEEEFREFAYELGYEIDVLDGRVDTVPLIAILNRIGFPINWRNIIDID